MAFNKKNIATNRTLGERLREIREEAGLNFEDIEQETGVSKKYVQYLEEGRYEQLPGEVYIKSFLKKYAGILKINEEKVLQMYNKEKRIFQGLDKKGEKRYLPPKSKVHFTPFNPKFFRNIIIIVLVIGILIYLGWELTHVIAPPQLEIFYPPDKLVTNEKNLEIAGTTEPESKVLVNGREVYVDSEGKFTEEIVLKEGVNVIKISAHKKQGKESTVQREILYKIIE